MVFKKHHVVVLYHDIDLYPVTTCAWKSGGGVAGGVVRCVVGVVKCCEVVGGVSGGRCGKGGVLR